MAIGGSGSAMHALLATLASAATVGTMRSPSGMEQTEGKCDGVGTALGDVTYGTMTTPGIDKLPLDLMLEHQLQGASCSRASIGEVIVVVNGRGGEVQIPPGATGLPLNRAQRSDPEFLARYFSDARARVLTDLWSAKENIQPMEYTHAVLAFLGRCRTTYCAWTDPDILVHRPPGGPGWVDIAVSQLGSTTNASFVSVGDMEDLGKDKGCRTQGGLSSFSSRYFVVHRSRFLASMPRHMSCAPACDTLEQMLAVSGRGRTEGLQLQCDAGAAWLVHPPDDTRDYLAQLRRCGSLERGLKRVLLRAEDPPQGKFPFAMHGWSIKSRGGLRLGCRV